MDNIKDIVYKLFEEDSKEIVQDIRATVSSVQRSIQVNMLHNREFSDSDILNAIDSANDEIASLYVREIRKSIGTKLNLFSEKLKVYRSITEDVEFFEKRNEIKNAEVEITRN